MTCCLLIFLEISFFSGQKSLPKLNGFNFVHLIDKSLVDSPIFKDSFTFQILSFICFGVKKSNDMKVGKVFRMSLIAKTIVLSTSKGNQASHE